MELAAKNGNEVKQESDSNDHPAIVEVRATQLGSFFFPNLPSTNSPFNKDIRIRVL